MVDMPERGGFTWFGDPLADGAVFAIHGKIRRAVWYAELGLTSAQRNGHKVTPELCDRIWRWALDQEAEEMAKTRARGIAPSIRRLLTAKRKKNVVRCAADMVLDADDFTDFIQNSGLVGLSHHARHQEFLPEERELTTEEDETLFSESVDGRVPERLSRKVRQVFAEREYRSVHLFADSRERWHLFFFALGDITGDPSTGKHHWRGGTHIHYLSHLFDPRLSKTAAWSALDGRTHSLPCVHIRYRPRASRADDGRRMLLDEATRRAAVIHVK